MHYIYQFFKLHQYNLKILNKLSHLQFIKYILYHFRTKFFPNEPKKNGGNDKLNGVHSAKTDDLSTPTPAIRQSLGPNTATLYSKTSSSIHRTNRQNHENTRRSKIKTQLERIKHGQNFIKVISIYLDCSIVLVKQTKCFYLLINSSQQMISFNDYHEFS